MCDILEDDTSSAKHTKNIRSLICKRKSSNTISSSKIYIQNSRYALYIVDLHFRGINFSMSRTKIELGMWHTKFQIAQDHQYDPAANFALRSFLKIFPDGALGIELTKKTFCSRL